MRWPRPSMTWIANGGCPRSGLSGCAWWSRWLSGCSLWGASVFRSCVRVPDSGAADFFIQFEPMRVICEVYRPTGVTAGASRRWPDGATNAMTGALLIG